jgi:hypothetical protein
VTAQGRNVFPGTGKNYAPGVFIDMALELAVQTTILAVCLHSLFFSMAT